MNLHAVCYYRSKSDEWTDPWSDRHFLARNLIKGVKQSSFGGHSFLKLLNGKSLKLDSTPKGQRVALSFASANLVKLLRDAGYENAHIIPVPSSSHVKPGTEFTGSRLAEAIQGRDENLKAKPVRFSRPHSFRRGEHCSASSPNGKRVSPRRSLRSAGEGELVVG